jgi:hypothetical protein
MTDAWRDLAERRFPELPLDCGNDRDPGHRYCEDLRDWSDKATTPDQKRIEHYIDGFDLRQKRVLHIGIGNSSLAKRFHKRVMEIVGTTIDEPEMAVAGSLAIPKYRYVMHNKYSGDDGPVEGTFDFILDNNPTSPCCCIRHLFEMFDFYVRKLAPGGQIVTDREGLGWVPDEVNQRWRFTFGDLEMVAAAAGLGATKVNRDTYVLSRGAPLRRSARSLAQHWARRLAQLPGQVARNGPRLLVRAVRRLTR